MNFFSSFARSKLDSTYPHDKNIPSNFSTWFTVTSVKQAVCNSSLQLILLSTLCAIVLLLGTTNRPLFAANPQSGQNMPLMAITWIRYVDKDATGIAPDGLSWTSAFTNVQDALSQAAMLVPTDTVEIWVAEGIYYPDQGISQVNNNISSTFQLRTEVELYGGFVGTETSRDQRNWTTHRTILSGDIDGNGTSSNNALHVVNGSNTTNKAALDGFVISGGAATGASCPQACGGGMYNDSGLATLTNLLFVGNIAQYGGGMYNTNFSRPTINNLIFSGNQATADGGGMYNNGVTVTTVNSLFYANTAVRGGGVFNTSASTFGSKFRNVIFWHNSAVSGKIDFYNDESDVSTEGTILTYGLIEWGCPVETACDNWSNADPQFVDADGIDNLPGTIDDDLRLKATSPAVEAGLDSYVNVKITTDYGGAARKVDGNGDGSSIVDLGPYEFQGYNLYVGLSVTPIAVAPGSTITYQLQISNSGLLPATGIILTATFASEVTLLGSSSSGIVITQTSTTPRVWQVANLAPGSSGVITLSGTVTGASWVNATAVITGDAGDIVPANNSATTGVYLTGVRYVAPNAPGPLHIGTSWTNAFTTVQDALLTSFAGDEIWVAAGTFYPDEGSGQTSNSKASTFRLKDGVTVYGGFAGNETARSQRNWQSNLSVLSGDLDQNDTVDNSGSVVISGTNAYHVVTGSGVTNTAVLDGFIIRNGFANGGTDTPCNDLCGGGMINTSGNPILENLTFYGNRSTYDGAGMFNYASQPLLNNLLFVSNRATRDGGGVYNSNSHPMMSSIVISANQAGGDGGGLYNYITSNPILSNILIYGNSAGSDGGGIYNKTSHPVLSDVVIQNNRATAFGGGIVNNYGSHAQMTTIQLNSNQAANGGGMYNDRTSLPQLTDVAFYANRATTNGGGVYNKTNSSATITNTTFISNTSQFGGGMYNQSSSPILKNVLLVANLATTSGGGIYDSQSSVPVLNNVSIANNRAITDGGAIYNVGSSPQIRNSILWGNSPSQQIFNKTGSNPVITYTLVQAACTLGQTCNGVLQADPQFRDINGSDNLTYTADDDVHLSLGSPAVDVASNALVSSTLTFDLDHKPRLIDGDGNGSITVDLGAYEFQRYDLGLSMAVTPIQPLPHDTVTYTLWYSNSGPSTAENVQIINNLPLSVSLSSIESSGALITQTGTSPLHWQVTDLAAGDSGMITITGVLTDQAWISNTATIAANFEDAHTANNSANVGFYLTGIRYVDTNAAGSKHDGLAWSTAYTDLQTALGAAQPGDEIWVAAGIYRTDEGNQVNDDANPP